MKGRRTAAEYHLALQLLTTAEETVLVEKIQMLQDLGFPPEIYKITNFSRDILARKGVKAKVSNSWWKGFKRRHPEIATQWTNQMDFVRIARANNLEAMTKYFENLERAIIKYNIQPSDIYNMDEVGFRFGFAKRTKVANDKI